MPKPILIAETPTRRLRLWNDRRSRMLVLEETVDRRSAERVRLSYDELAKICEAVAVKKKVRDGND